MRKLLFLLLVVLLPIFAYAEIPQWQIIPEQSSLSFTAIQNGAPVTGQFKIFSGEIFVDPNNYKASNIHIVVDINSLSAAYADIRNTLLTSDWFNAQLFPKAEFKSNGFNKIGDRSYQAMGILTIRDKSAPVTLTFSAIESPKDMAHVEGSTTLKRSTFGVGQGEWAGTEQIKDEVRVDFKIVAKKKP